MNHDPFVSLSSLESDLRSRFEGELRELEERRVRLERDARAADEFVRRVSSMMPAPSPAAMSLYPSLAASAHAAAPEPVREPASQRLAAAYPSSHTMATARAPRPSALAGIAAALAVAMSFAALLVATGQRAEIPAASAAEPAPHPRAMACAGAVEATAPVASAAAAPARAPVTPASTVLAPAPGAPPRPVPARFATAALRARPAPGAAPAATTPGAKLEDAARTATMLREQLSTTVG